MGTGKEDSEKRGPSKACGLLKDAGDHGHAVQGAGAWAVKEGGRGGGRGRWRGGEGEGGGGGARGSERGGGGGGGSGYSQHQPAARGLQSPRAPEEGAFSCPSPGRRPSPHPATCGLAS